MLTETSQLQMPPWKSNPQMDASASLLETLKKEEGRKDGRKGKKQAEGKTINTRMELSEKRE